MNRLKTSRLNRVLALVLTIVALATGQEAWGYPTTGVGVGIYGHTNGSVYRYTVASSAGPSYPCGLTNGTEKRFDSRNSDSQFNIGNNGVTRDLTMTLNGWLTFANSNSATNVTAGIGGFEIVFTSANYYITTATVTTLAGDAVEGCMVSGTYTKTLTVTIPSGTTFGTINLAIATHTPLNYCTISGIEDCYIDDGVNEPVPTVTLEGKTLRQDVDYTLSWSQGTSTGSVTVTGAGDYVGSKSQHYNIREPNLSDLHSLGTNIYEIASQQDLDYLARIVKGKLGTPGNDCSGLTFRQTADIAYTNNSAWDYVSSGGFDSNFTPVGIYGSSFRGTFDGQGHTISGIRVCKSGSGTTACSLGLFGYLGDGGTVKNVVLSDANIYGYQNIGGIVGYSNGTVTDCFLCHVRVQTTYDNDYSSIVVGNQGGTITRTHYRDCCEYQIGGNGQSYNDYISSVFTLTTDANVVLPERTGGNVVSASMTTYDDGLTLDGTQYYTESTEITLAYSGTVPDGYWPRFTATSGSDDKTAEVIDGATLTIPGYDISVACNEFLPVVSYLDADGNLQTCSGYTIITSSSGNAYYGTAGKTHWYVVSSDVTISGRLQIQGANVHLILCDGKTLSVNSEGMAISIYGSLTIYGQQQGNGTLNAYSTLSSAISSGSSDITILGGSISAISNHSSAYGISPGNNKTITLGWTRPANRITANSYEGTIKIADGQLFTDGSGNNFFGTITDVSTIAGKTLEPYGVTVSMNSSGIRTYASPYDLDMSAVDAYVISAQSGEKLTLTPVTEAPANTGMLLKAKNDSQKGATVVLPLTTNAATVGTNLLKPVLSSETIVTQTDGDYTNFILANGAHGIDWYTLSTSGAIGANKAYLQLLTANVPSSSSRGFTWVIDGGTTGIVDNKRETITNNHWYDLSGRKLSGKPTAKGLYIHNGKTIVITP